MDRGVAVRILLDSSQTANSSSTKQMIRVVDLIERGVEVRTGGCQGRRRTVHQKCLVVDDAVCLFGSANMTENSMNHCYEFGVQSTQNCLVEACLAKLDRLWSDAAVVEVEVARQRRDERCDRSSRSYDSRSRDRSQSSHPVRRTLTMHDVDHDHHGNL